MQRITLEPIHGFSIRRIYGSLKFVSLGNARGYFVALISVINRMFCTFIDLKQTLHILQNPQNISKKWTAPRSTLVSQRTLCTILSLFCTSPTTTYPKPILNLCCENISASQSWNLRFWLSPNNVTLIEGKASVSSSRNLSSKVLLISILPPVPTMNTPPALWNI